MPSWKKLLVSGSNATVPSVSTAADFTIDAGGDIILDADGTDILLKDGGTEFGSFKRVSSDFIIKSATNDKDIVFKGVDNSATITALTLDMSEGGDAIFGGNVSGASTSTGSFGRVDTVGDLHVGDDLYIAGGVIDLKNTGEQSVVRFYCESSNAHYAEIQAPEHTDFAGNVTLTLPSTTGTLALSSEIPSATSISGSLGSNATLIRSLTAASISGSTVTQSFSNGTAALISGSATSTGSFGHLVLGNRDTDATFEFGRAHIGFIGFSDMVGFSHVDYDGTGTFALAQSSAGKTIVQAAGGQPIAFKIGGSDKVQINSSGDLGVGIETALHKLHVVGDGFFTGDVSGSATSTGSFGRLKVDSRAIIGEAYIGQWEAAANYAIFANSELDQTAAGNYSILAQNNGKTLINAATSREISFRINNSEKAVFDSSGNFIIDGNVSGSATSTGSFGKLLGDGSSLSGISSDVVNDTSPQLGGDLDLNSNDITGTGNIDITGNITARNFIVSSSVTNIVYQALSGSTIFGDTSDDTHRFTGSIFVQSGSISQELHTVTNSDRMFFGRSTQGIPVSGSSNISRFATDSGGNTIDLGYTTVDGDGKTVLVAVGDGIHNDLTNYWYNNNFFRVGTSGDLDGANFQGLNSQYVHYDLDSLRVKGNIIATTGSLQGEVFINSPSGSSMFIGKYTGGIPVSGSDNISRYATGSDGSIIDLGFTTLDGDGNSVLTTTGDGIYVDDNNYWYTTGHFKIGSSTNRFNWDTTSLSFTGPLTASGDLVPSTHNTYDLGADSYRWANIYTADLQLSNENATPNEIDGTTGSWTIQEGEDDLYLLNRKNGKKYRFKLEEIE